MALQRPPGPKKHPIFGDLREFNRNSLEFEKRIAREYGDIVHLRFLHLEGYQINHPDDVHQVLVTEAQKFQKSPIYKLLLRRFLGDGLLTSNGDFWRRQRKLVQPAFHSRRIQNYAEVMVSFAQAMLDRWEDGSVHDINREMMRLTLGVVAKTLFDADVEAQAEKVGDALTEVLESSNEIATSGMMFLPEWLPTRANRRSRAATKVLNDIVSEIIEQRRASGEDKGDLLSMLLAAEDEDGNRMTDKQVRDEAVTLFLAGHETTANALTWAFMLLSQHPDVEAKLHEELAQVLGGRAPGLEDLRRLEYTQMVFKETLRLYPAAPTFARMPIEDVVIGGHPMPKGTVVMISAHAIHRDPRWYPEPDAFKPERFSKENIGSIPKYAYIPFAAGPRVCIGNQFAEMEAILVMATMAQRFRLRLEPGQVIEPEAVLTLRPKYPFFMRAEARVQEAEREQVGA